MEYLVYSNTARAGAIFRVSLSNQAYVYLLDPANFVRFKANQNFSGIGGWAVRTPVFLRAPQWGTWHVIVYGAFVTAQFATILP